MVVEGVRNEFTAAQGMEAGSHRRSNDQKSEALALNRKEITYGVLHRDATSNQEIFQSLLQRTRETGISRELTGHNIRVVDRCGHAILAGVAEDGAQSAAGDPRRRGAGRRPGVLPSTSNKRVKTPEEIRQQLRLPFLGLVPRVKHGRSETPLINNGVPAGFAEAFRAVRTKVLFASADDARSLLVTSTGPAEGKTVVASNLAIGLALTGQRVLLLDGDMRRPRVHQVFDVRLEPGLSDLVASAGKPADVIKPTSVSNLWILTAGVSTENPAEILSSQRFKQLLTALGEEYRLDRDRLAPGHGRHGCVDPVPRGVRCCLRRHGGQDEPRERARRARPAGCGAGDVCRRGPERRRSRAKRVLLLVVLPPRVPRVLPRRTASLELKPRSTNDHPCVNPLQLRRPFPRSSRCRGRSASGLRHGASRRCSALRAMCRSSPRPSCSRTSCGSSSRRHRPSSAPRCCSSPLSCRSSSQRCGTPACTRSSGATSGCARSGRSARPPCGRSGRFSSCAWRCRTPSPICGCRSPSS